MSRAATLSKKTSKNRSAKPAIAIIGSGRIGTAMGIALTRARYKVPLVLSLHSTKAKRAARLIGRDTRGQSLTRALADKDFRETLGRMDVLLIATVDDAIEPVAKELAAFFGKKSTQDRKANSIAMHTSGALSSLALQKLKSIGFAVGSLHPLVSISNSQTGADLLAGASFSLEGDARAVAFGKKLVRDLGSESFQISADAKPLYHAAALMVSPNMTALFDIALEMLQRCGVSRNKARQLLLPLVHSTIVNLQAQDPKKALTGTFTRGDFQTAQRHIAAIEGLGLTDALSTYVVLAQRSLNISKEHRNESKIRRLLINASLSKRRK